MESGKKGGEEAEAGEEGAREEKIGGQIVCKYVTSSFIKIGPRGGPYKHFSCMAVVEWCMKHYIICMFMDFSPGDAGSS